MAKQYPDLYAKAKKLKVDALLKPEELQPLLSLGFLTVTNAALRAAKKETVTSEEAQRWGDVTTKVYGRFLLSLTTGHIVFGLVTAGILVPKIIGPANNAVPFKAPAKKEEPAGGQLQQQQP